MAKFDVFSNRPEEGYLLDLQTDFLQDLDSRIVAPLLPVAKMSNIARRLNPVFEIEGENYIMITQSMAAVPASILKNPVTSLKGKATEITNALDMIFYGF